MGTKNGRAAAIRSIVRESSIRTQRELVDELHACGFDCTQATVSRDVSYLNLRKLPGGSYVLAEDLHLQRMLSEFAVSVKRSESLVVVRTQPGCASMPSSSTCSARSAAMTRCSWSPTPSRLRRTSAPASPSSRKSKPRTQ